MAKDIFKDAMTKDLFIKEEKENCILYKVSFNRYNDFYDELLTISKDVPLDIELYDERVLTLGEDVRYFMSKLNEYNINSLNLYLSDDMLRIYTVKISKEEWKHQQNTVFNLSIDRKPLEAKTDMLIFAPGMINLEEEKLIRYRDDILSELKYKTIKSTLTNTRGLKKISKDYYKLIKDKYYLEQLSDIQKTILAYSYIDSEVKYDFKHGRGNEFDNPKLAFENKKGTSHARSRLMVALLNNDYMKVDATVIEGLNSAKKEESWVGIHIEDNLYHCIMKKGIGLNDPKRLRYKIDQNNPYVKVYESVQMSDERYVDVVMDLEMKRKK